MSLAWAQPERPIRVNKKEKKEPVTQALEALPDPPAAILGETARLVFHVSPLSNKGLLSQQIRDALKAIDKANGGATLLKVRAFVAGNGDLRRVQQIITEEFGEKRLPLPAVSTIQAGRLPMEGAQVVLETVSLDTKSVNPRGLAFFSGTKTKNLGSAIQALTALEAVAGVSARGFVRVTCFLNAIDNPATARQQVQIAFPAAAVHLLELTRLGTEEIASCEAVGRRDGPVLSEAVVRKEGVVLTSAAKLAFTGLQLAFRADDADLKLAEERLLKLVEGVKAQEVLFTSSYALRSSVRSRLADLHAGAGTALVFEGLPSLDALAAMEAVGALR